MILTLSIASVSAKAPADTTAVFNVMPKMSCQNCENKIKSNLRFEKGIKSIETSLDEQTVKVTFNPKKTNVEAIQKGFKKIGYSATPITGCDDNQKAENKTVKE